jgi:hypothetical protein
VSYHHGYHPRWKSWSHLFSGLLQLWH